MVASRPGTDAVDHEPGRSPDDAAVHALAARVVRARRAAGLTLAAVADRARVSAAYVSQIESATANPTVRSLARVADALGTPLGELLSSPGDHAPQGRRFEPRFAATPRAATTAGAQAIWDLTAMGSSRIGARLVRGDVGDHANPTSHAGEEFLMVLAGRCRLHVGGLTRDLTPFAACHFASSDPHHIDQASEDLLMLAVLTGS
ncbi:helix-turn-helix domain-containing protein [Krasilnikovia sp. MM14-A1004]|uniref:helix-turn-helix domain-containing protein n=1 Tax=Krasilnikovia sp. MM14-A1004 TaxID=3373541 RepID=UPI00399D2FA8